METLHALRLVRFCTLGQGGEEAAQVHPGGVAEDDGAGRVVCVQEGAEEGVEVVGRGGEVKPDGGEGGVNGGVEGWHAGDGGGVVDECSLEDADGGGCHGDFDRVVDVGDDHPPLGFGEVGQHGPGDGQAWRYRVDGERLAVSMGQLRR